MYQIINYHIKGPFLLTRTWTLKSQMIHKWNLKMTKGLTTFHKEFLMVNYSISGAVDSIAMSQTQNANLGKGQKKPKSKSSSRVKIFWLSFFSSVKKIKTTGIQNIWS